MKQLIKEYVMTIIALGIVGLVVGVCSYSLGLDVQKNKDASSCSDSMEYQAQVCIRDCKKELDESAVYCYDLITKVCGVKIEN